MHTPVSEVRLWDQRVGAVAPDPRAGCHVFEYDPAWRRRGIELAPLTMPTDAAEPVFLFPDLARQSFHGLPGLLADALRSEEHTSELQSLMRISYAVFCLQKKTTAHVVYKSQQ